MDGIYTIEFYQTKGGKRPLEVWLNSLETTIGARINAKIEAIGLGKFGGCKSLGKGLWEIKIDLGPGFRIYYAPRGNKIILLLSGGDKSTQSKDLKRARTYLEDWKERT